ncbi:PASTA domain-containing protein [Lactococcus formosensis]|uniref:PASTA domain-containing protein n=1 Tax=Lactococcus formosensis TaxID=1281486 RepID=UPI0022E21D96|nr:PASTA domain-containing protein [Lactococcus formosensis]
MKKKIFNKVVIVLAVLLSIIIITAGILGRQILFRDYPVFQSMSQKEIIETTNILPEDNDYVKKLKNNALDVYLSNASSELAEKLGKNEKRVNSIVNGELPENQFSQNQEELQQALGASDEQMTQLSQTYENARLNRAIDQLQSEAKTLKAEQLPQFIKDANQLTKQTEKSIQSYIEDNNAVSKSTISASVQTLHDANSLLNNFTQFVNYTNNYTTITNLQFDKISTNNSLMEDFLPVFNKVNAYLSQKETVEARIKELTDFQQKVEKSEQLRNSSIELPNLKGQTLADIRKKTGSNYKIEVEPTDENKDTSIVTRQVPDPSDFDRILKGETITVQTKKKAEEKKPSSNTNKKDEDKTDKKGESKSKVKNKGDN